MQLRTLGALALGDRSLRRPKPLLLLAYLSLEGARRRPLLKELFFHDALDPSDALSTTLRRLKSFGAVAESGGLIRCTAECDAKELLALLDAGAVERALSLYRGAFLATLTGHLEAELEEWVYGTREFIAHRVRNALLKTAEAALAAGDETAAQARAEEAFSLRGAAEPQPDELLRLLRIFGAHESTAALKARQQAAQQGIALAAGGRQESQQPRPAPAQRRLPTPPTSLIGRDEELVEIARLLGQRECRLLTLHGPAGVGKSRLALQVAADLLATAHRDMGVAFVPTEEVEAVADVPAAAAAHLDLPPSQPVASWSDLAGAIGDRRLLLVLDGFEHLAEAASELRDLLSACHSLKLLVTSRQRLNLLEEWVMPLRGLRVPAESLSWEDALLSESLQLFVRRAQTANVTFTLTPKDLPHAKRICSVVDGFPLGIELAAAWTRTLTLEDLADSLTKDLSVLGHHRLDAGSKHQSLWLTLEHSWAQLDDELQATLAKLSVFKGGFKREAAAAVAQASIPQLMSLVDASLVRMDADGRFDQHALLAQFACEKLAGMGAAEATARADHAEYYIGQLVAASGHTGARDLHAAFALLKQEESNLLACLEWAATNRRYDLLLAISDPLTWYFPMDGRFAAGRQVFAATLTRLAPTLGDQDGSSASGADADDAAQAADASAPELQEVAASLLLGQAWLARYAGSLARAQTLSLEGERYARASGSQRQLVRALDLRGQAVTYDGLFDEARALLSEAVTVARSLAEPLPTARVLCNLALVEALSGYTDVADELLREARAPFDDGALAPNLDAVAIMLAQAVNGWCRGDHRATSSAAGEGLALAESLGYMGPVPLLKALMAAALLALGERTGEGYLVDEARQQLADGLSMVEQTQEGMATSMLHGVASALALRDGRPELAAHEAREAYRVGQTAGNAVIKLWSLPPLVDAYLASGETSRALALAQRLRSHPAAPRWLKDEAGRLANSLGAAAGVDPDGGADAEVSAPEIGLDELVGSIG